MAPSIRYNDSKETLPSARRQPVRCCGSVRPYRRPSSWIQGISGRSAFSITVSRSGQSLWALSRGFLGVIRPRRMYKSAEIRATSQNQSLATRSSSCGSGGFTAPISIAGLAVRAMTERIKSVFYSVRLRFQCFRNRRWKMHVMRIPLLKNSIPVNSEKSKAEIFL